MKIKPNTYYKRSYDTNNEDYSIYYTDNETVYIIASKYINEPLFKCTKKCKWGSFRSLQTRTKNVVEISKEDVFLELL